MKNRINLYLEQLRPVKEFLPLNVSLSIWLVSVVIIGLLIGTLLWLKTQQQEVNQLLALELQTTQQLLTKRVNEFTQRNDKAALIIAKNKLLKLIEKNDRILKVIKQQTQSNNQGFSSLFSALAQQSVDNVWLTAIAVQHSAIKLQGGALHSKDIPNWIEGLKGAEGLAGQDFSSLEITRAADHLEFILNNDVSSISMGVSP